MQDMTSFFHAYADRFNRALTGDVDIEGTARSFTDCFIGVDPNGVNCGTNDEQLRSSMAAGFEFYRAIGTRRMDVDGVDTEVLDELHVLARVHWRAHYDRKGEAIDIPFTNIYFLRLAGDEPRIFGFITGDEQQVLRDNGLIT